MTESPDAAQWLADALERDITDVASWEPSASFRNDLGLDSLDLLEALLILEADIGRELPAEVLDTIDSLTDLQHWLDTEAS